MHLKNSCRLCLSNEGEFYKLFGASQEEATLADELNSLLSFQIIKKEYLPESICSNCHKINSFFKEFRSKCAQVNDYIYRLHELQGCSFGDIAIKTENIDEYEDNSGGDARKSTDEELVLRQGRTAACEEAPYPVALLTLRYKENLDELRSNFISGERLRDVAGNIIPECEEQFTDISSRRGQKRRIEDKPEGTQMSKADFTPRDVLLCEVKMERCNDEGSQVHLDNFDRLADSEENSNYELTVRKDLYSPDLNCLRNHENLPDSGPNLLSGSVLNDESCQSVNELSKSLTEVPEEASVLCKKKRQKTMPDLENNHKSTKVADYSSPVVGSQMDHVVKHEEIDIYDSPVEELSDSDSLDEQKSSDQSYLSDSVDNDRSVSLQVVDGDSLSSCSSYSSEDSDEETEMLLLLAMLM